MTKFGKTLCAVAVCILQGAVAPSSATAPPVSRYIRPTNQKPHSDQAIVFVHGFLGDSESTWAHSPAVYWPTLLLSDDAFKEYDIYVADYRSELVLGNKTVEDVVSNLRNRLDGDDIFTKHHQVVFVCHSLGGIIVQRLLVANPEYASKVPFIYFFAVPETGSDVARYVKVFSSNPILEALSGGDGNNYLQALETDWKRVSPKIRKYCAYEKKRTKGVIVVERLSGTRNCDEAVAIDEDHEGIVKPSNAGDDSYLALRNAVRRNLLVQRSTPPLAGIPNKNRQDGSAHQYEDRGTRSPVGAATSPFSVDLTAPLITTGRNMLGNITSVAERAKGQYIIVPLNVCVWVSLTNLQSTEAMVEKYTVEIKTKSSQWVKLSRVETRSFEFYWIGDGLKNAQLLHMTRLDDQLSGRWLRPRDNVRGWAFFEYPPGSDRDGFDFTFRVSVSDNAGTRYVSDELVITKENSLDRVQGSVLKLLPQKIDLTNAEIRLAQQ